MDLLKAASSANLAAARALQQRVWVQVKDEDTWVLASVTGRFGGSVHLQRAHAPAGVDEILVVDEEDFATYAPVSETVDELVDDLAQLEEVNEAVILHTLRARYESDVIYTAIGPILIAINPFKQLRTCSEDAVAEMAARAMQIGDEIKTPHILQARATRLQFQTPTLQPHAFLSARVSIGTAAGGGASVLQAFRAGGGGWTDSPRRRSGEGKALCHPRRHRLRRSRLLVVRGL
eukprot:6213116-Pleurochrysis_carterae.AAC.1